MTTRQLHHLYYNAKELKLPLELGIKIPFDSEARTFDEVLIIKSASSQQFILLEK